MLDMYDFENGIWLCHSFGGKCYNFTAFVSFVPELSRAIQISEIPQLATNPE